MDMETAKELLIATSPTSKGVIAKRFARDKRLKGWRTATAAWSKVLARSSLPDVTVVDMGSDTSGGSLKSYIRELAAKQEATAHVTFLVLAFSSSRPPAAAKVTEVLRPFSRPERVEITWSASPAKLGVVVEAIEPKLAVLREVEAAKSSPRPSSLDRIEKVLAATRDLRAGNGNLSARRLADLYGISLSELGRWMGRSRQALNKAPEAESLQDSLAFFERIARIRLRLSDVDFRKWLRIPNALLDGKRPLDLLAQGQWQVLADFVDDLLTGSPT